MGKHLHVSLLKNRDHNNRSNSHQHYREGESLSALSRRTDSAWSVEETAIANGIPAEGRLYGGQPVKIAVEVPYRQ